MSGSGYYRLSSLNSSSSNGEFSAHDPIFGGPSNRGLVPRKKGSPNVKMSPAHRRMLHQRQKIDLRPHHSEEVKMEIVSSTPMPQMNVPVKTEQLKKAADVDSLADMFSGMDIAEVHRATKAAMDNAKAEDFYPMTEEEFQHALTVWLFEGVSQAFAGATTINKPNTSTIPAMDPRFAIEFDRFCRNNYTFTPLPRF